MTTILNDNIQLLAQSQESKEVIINENIRALSIFRYAVKSKSLTVPPTNPSADDCYLVPSNATGAWLNKNNYLSAPALNIHGNVITNQWIFFNPVGTVYVEDEISFYRWDETNNKWRRILGDSPLIIALSDESSTILPTENVTTIRLPYNTIIKEVRASVSEAPTGSNIAVDILVNSLSILSQKITIEVNEKTSISAANQPTLLSNSFSDDTEISFNIDSVGAIFSGRGLKVYLLIYQED